tara:strand:- start:47 stop:799 length:753 start_codon:yes stop_codon:yes gene_type:complete
MPKSKSATQSTKKVETKVVPPKVVEQKVVKPKTKKIVKKVKKAVVEEPVIEPEVVEETTVEEPVVEEPVVEQGEETDFIEENAEELVSDKKQKKQKKVVNKDKIKSDWENLLTVYAEELSHLKKKPEQRQSLLKALRELKSDSFRLMKIRNKAPSSGNSKSGFNMPVNVTSEMKNFISSNQDTDAEITRSHITRTLCAYVKNKDLQNPDDRREILPDSTLKSLFTMQDDQNDKLTYYSMQRKIQQHIVKN